MNILALETSTPSGGAALMKNGYIEGELYINNAPSHSRTCLGFCQTLMETAKMKWQDLDAIAVSVGPGSFTGLRVGITIAKALAWSHQIPVLAVSSIEALAHRGYTGQHVSHVVPMLDARIGEVYTAVFRVEDNQGMLLRSHDDVALKPEKAFSLVNEPALYMGEGALRYAQHLPEGSLLARPECMRAAPSSTAVVAARKLEAGEAISAQELAAVYLREAVSK